MRQKISVTVFLAACSIVLMVFNGWAAQPRVLVSHSGAARGVAHYIMGYTAELQGAMDDAAEHYKQSIEDDGSSAVVHLRLASAYAQLGRSSDAIRIAEKAVQLSSGDLKAHYFLALLYSDQKQNVKAFSEYEHIFKTLAGQEPDNIEFPLYLGQLYHSAGQEEKAMEQFAVALTIDPGNADLLYILGTYYLEKSRRSEGVKLLKQCLDLTPLSSDCLNSLAYSYAEDNANLDEALKHVNKALAIDSNNAAYLDTRGWVYYRQGRYEQALQDLMRANGILKDPTILEHIAEVYLKLGNQVESKKFQLEKEQVLNANVKQVP